MTGPGPRLVRLLGLLAAVGLGATTLVLPGVAATASTGCSETYGGHGRAGTWSASEPLTRSFYDTSGATSTSNCFTLSVDKHTDLQDHERITVSWSGAHPTGGRSLNPYGESGLPQEYPVVLMECRGVDPKDYGGTAPAGKETVSPQTCWTNTFFQRTNSAGAGQGIWQADASNSDDTSHIQGIDPAEVPASCNVTAGSDYEITPFLAADGTLYAGCSSSSMPPEATVSSISIPNEVYAFTSTDGKGTFAFEARTALENQSLGCSSSVPCTLEAIPIDGVNCDNPDPHAVCNETGQLPAGAVNPGAAPQDAVAPAFWASASNWDRRVPVPLTFAPPPSVCSVAAAGKPVPFYGSELLDQAALQWVPAYCLNKKRFNWQDNVMPDDAAFGLMQSGQAAAALVSAQGTGTGVGYAPTAATGWAIAFDIDKPGNAGQQMSIKLTPLLLGKLLTESYPGSTTVAAGHPGFSRNPLSLNLDPDFYKLNPGLDRTHWSEAASTLLATSTSSQVMYQLTSYVASDPKAMAFINGKPEHEGPYTMRVNPAYKGLQLPVDSWPQLDTWRFKTTSNPCLQAEGSGMPPYMPLIANPTTSLQLVAQALLYNWPNVETACTGTGTQQDPYQLARTAPAGVGSRFMLGLVTLGDAHRYGLTTADLQAAPGHFVAAGTPGIQAALALAKPTGAMLPFALTQARIRASARAYPGTMLVYTAAKTHGLPARQAKDVAQFIRVSSTEGQRPGRGNGQLAAGYVPIANKGVTKAFFRQAQQVASAVAAQKAPPAPKPPHSGTPNPPTTPSGPPTTPTSPTGSTPTPPSVSPPTAPSGSTPTPPVSNAPVMTTAAVSSSFSGGLLVGLIVIGALASTGVLAGRVALRVKGLRWASRP